MKSPVTGFVFDTGSMAGGRKRGRKRGRGRTCRWARCRLVLERVIAVGRGRG